VTASISGSAVVYSVRGKGEKKGGKILGPFEGRSNSPDKGGKRAGLDPACSHAARKRGERLSEFPGFRTAQTEGGSH